MAGLGIALGALVIIDSFGVVVGFVSSNPRAGEAIQAARRWARRILRRPPAADLEEGADTEEAARAALDALEQEAQKAQLAHEKLQAAEAAEADRRAKVAAKQERLKQRARRIKIRPG